jgi:anti-anti-sigma factor
VAWVQVAGELDLATSPQLRETLEEAGRAASLVVLDLGELSFIASSGVHVILDIAGEARRNGGRLLIVRGPAQVDRMLELTEVCKQVLTMDLDPAEAAPQRARNTSPARCFNPAQVTTRKHRQARRTAD